MGEASLFQGFTGDDEAVIFIVVNFVAAGYKPEVVGCVHKFGMLSMKSLIRWWMSVMSDWVACSNWMIVMMSVQLDVSTKQAEWMP